MKSNEVKVSGIKEKINEIINGILAEEGKQVKGKIGDVVELLDSIEFVSLIVEVETEFDIEIDDKDYDFEKMNSVDKITDLVVHYINN